MRRVDHFYLKLLLPMLFALTGCGGGGGGGTPANAAPDVYAAGQSISDSGEKVPGYWKNGVWVSLAPLSPTKNSVVFDIVVQ